MCISRCNEITIDVPRRVVRSQQTCLDAYEITIDEASGDFPACVKGAIWERGNRYRYICNN